MEIEFLEPTTITFGNRILSRSPYDLFITLAASGSLLVALRGTEALPCNLSSVVSGELVISSSGYELLVTTREKQSNDVIYSVNTWFQISADGSITQAIQVSTQIDKPGSEIDSHSHTRVALEYLLLHPDEIESTSTRPSLNIQQLDISQSNQNNYGPENILLLVQRLTDLYGEKCIYSLVMIDKIIEQRLTRNVLKNLLLFKLGQISGNIGLKRLRVKLLVKIQPRLYSLSNVE
ncbi:MAG: hypothetical protein ABIE03_04530 [Patescibacteria group bacterium]|nr:hypothetical protein [Patescibacteria group bacterium]